jgi:hypothetical protein
MKTEPWLRVNESARRGSFLDLQAQVNAPPWTGNQVKPISRTAISCYLGTRIFGGGVLKHSDFYQFRTGGPIRSSAQAPACDARRSWMLVLLALILIASIAQPDSLMPADADTIDVHGKQVVSWFSMRPGSTNMPSWGWNHADQARQSRNTMSVTNACI